MMLTRVPIPALLLMLTLGCQQRLGDFTFLSTKNLDFSMLNTEVGAGGQDVEGVDKKSIIIFVQTGIPSVEDAIDRAIESGSGTGLTDAVIYYEYFYIPYIYGEMKFRVTGKVVK